MSDFALPEVVAGVAELMASTAHEKGLELAAMIAPDGPPWSAAISAASAKD